MSYRFGPATGVAVLGSHGISGVMGACAAGFAAVLAVMTLAGGVASGGGVGGSSNDRRGGKNAKALGKVD